MAYFKSHTDSGAESAWKGGLKWVKVKDREDVGKVIQNGRNIGDFSCTAVLFESTGEVRFYTGEGLTRADEDGNVEQGGEGAVGDF